jgi:two-component system catabolic regulation response regulator CreB
MQQIQVLVNELLPAVHDAQLALTSEKAILPPKNNEPQILLVYDDTEVTQLMELILRREGYSLEKSNINDEILNFLSDRTFDLMVLDLRLLDESLVESAIELCPELSIIVMGARTRENAVNTIEMTMGANAKAIVDYIEVPWEASDFLAQIDKVLHRGDTDS